MEIKVPACYPCSKESMAGWLLFISVESEFFSCIMGTQRNPKCVRWILTRQEPILRLIVYEICFVLVFTLGILKPVKLYFFTYHKNIKLVKASEWRLHSTPKGSQKTYGRDRSFPAWQRLHHSCALVHASMNVIWTFVHINLAKKNKRIIITCQLSVSSKEPSTATSDRTSKRQYV